MTKHTPGKWTYSQFGTGGEFLITAPSDDPEQLHILVAEVSRTARTKEAGLANAQLIAAAPDLYEAMIWILYCASGIGKSGGPPSDSEFDAALDAGKAAIAKAQGEKENTT